MADFQNGLISQSSYRMVFRVVFGIFNFSNICKGYVFLKVADFQNAQNNSNFLAQNKSNLLVEWLFACFSHFKFLTQTDHFAKAIAFAWAIAFARWPIFKMVSFLEYLVFFRALFCTE